MKPKRVKKKSKQFNVNLNESLLKRVNIARVVLNYTWPYLLTVLLEDWLRETEGDK